MVHNGHQPATGIVSTGRPRLRALAAALRRERIEAKFTGRELARRLDMSHTTISQWETGQRVPGIVEVASVLTALRVTGERRQLILDLATEAREPNWLTFGTPGVAQQLAGTIECERMAATITVWSPTVVPGLLQTSDYTRAMMQAEGLPPEKIESGVEIRAHRRDVLAWPNKVRYRALIAEQALREIIGDRAIMVEQLRSLRLHRAQCPRISVRVVSANQGWHPGLAGPFEVFDFAEAPSIVLLEHYRTGAFVYDADDVAAYQAAVKRLDWLALGAEESEKLIASIADEMERTT